MATRTPVKTELLTADDLLRLYSDGVRGELIRGVLSETMPAGTRHGKIAVNLSTELRLFVKPRRLGTLTASDAGVWLERNPDTVREPDIAFFSAEKMPLDAEVIGYAEVVPDLVVEFGSPSDSPSSLNDKALMWLRYGVRLVWVVHPDSRTVHVHREGVRTAVLTANDALDGMDVLPGFSCAVSELFA